MFEIISYQSNYNLLYVFFKDMKILVQDRVMKAQKRMFFLWEHEQNRIFSENKCQIL